MKAFVCLLGLLGSMVVACATTADEDTDPAGPATAELADDGKADGGELRVRAGNMTVWIDRAISIRRDANAIPFAVIRGRASRSLASAFASVPDDAFGEATIVGPRSFEVTLRGGHELNTIFSGLPLLVELDAVTDPSTKYTVQLELRPAFAKFEGASSIHVGSMLRPIFIGTDEPDTLRYAADVSTSAAPLTIANAGAAQAVPASGGFDVLFTYDDLEAAWSAGAKVAFTAGGKTKRAALEARMLKLAMTTQSPDDVWPPARCDEETYNCTLEHQGVDLQTCGDYRLVSHCAYADICEITDAAPLSLRPIDLSFAWQAKVAAYRGGCDQGGTWCSLTSIETFMVPECLAQEPTLAEVVAHVAAATDDQDFVAGPFANGTVLDRTSVQQTPVFSTSYSSGPALFQAIDAHMGSGEIRAWTVVEEVPCHNCTDHRYKTFVWWPAAFRIVAVTGGFGYDS